MFQFLIKKQEEKISDSYSDLTTWFCYKETCGKNFSICWRRKPGELSACNEYLKDKKAGKQKFF